MPTAHFRTDFVRIKRKKEGKEVKMTVRMLYGYITDYVRQREDRYIHPRPASYVLIVARNSRSRRIKAKRILPAY